MEIMYDEMREDWIKKCEDKYDIIGKKFGHWTVRAFAGVHSTQGYFIYDCECICGSGASIPLYKLKAGRTKSCGCMKNDKSGKQFFDIKVEYPTDSTLSRYLCTCKKCNDKIIIPDKYLRTAQNCGCSPKVNHVGKTVVYEGEIATVFKLTSFDENGTPLYTLKLSDGKTLKKCDISRLKVSQ